MGILSGLMGFGIAKDVGGHKNPAANAPQGLGLQQSQQGPLSSPGMPAMPGQSPLGMSVSAPPGNSLASSRGQRSPLG